MTEVPQTRFKTPFYAQQRAVDRLNRWHTWNGYTVPDTLYCEDLEYFSIRNSCSVFDLSPMQKYRITGPDALAFLNRLVTRDVAKLAAGRVGYSVWCDSRGHVIDDGTIFHFGDGRYRLCCAGRHAAWLADSATGFDVEIVDETDEVAALSVQGPTSYAVLSDAGVKGLESLKPFGVIETELNSLPLAVSRTGFTGDLGYELWMEPRDAEAIWKAIFAVDDKTRAIGTEALNLARLEATLLYPHIDFLPADETIRPGRSRSPFELGLSWLVDFKKPMFNGRQALAREYREGHRYEMLRLDIEGNKPATNAYIFAKPGGGKDVGFVTSAAWSPVCKQNIALATVEASAVQSGKPLWVEIFYQREMRWHRKMAKARVVDGPFWNPDRKRQTPPSRF